MSLIDGLRGLVKRQFTSGVRRSVRRLGSELALQRRHHRSEKLARTLRGPIKLHLGCGDNLMAGWINVDLFVPEADLCLDIRESLPFGAESVALIYSEHMLEHLEYPGEVFGLLRECHRVMVPGGVFSVAVPDAAPLLEHYALRDTAFFKGSWNENYPAWLATPMHRINYLFHQLGEHKYAYDEEILTQALHEAGFGDVRRETAGPEPGCGLLRPGTLCVSATKVGERRLNEDRSPS